jgi:RNA polymerase sigma factor (TIGR02999 family)
MMPQDSPHPITALLERVRLGQKEAMDDLLPLVYRELRRLAQSSLQRERAGHTLQPTALIHEAFLRLFEGHAPSFTDRAHFFGVASRVMRQVLVDHARTRAAQKRGPQLRVEMNVNLAAIPPHGDLLELDEALDRLAVEDARLVTLIEMRFFAGMTAEEVAEARSESVHIVRHDLRYAQARLRRILDGTPVRPRIE